MPETHEESYRFANRISLPLLSWMACLAILTAGGGVGYATLKNEEVAIRNDIRGIEQDIAASKMRTNEHRAKINALTGKWNMHGRLTSLGSELRDISPNQIEELRTLNNTRTESATAAR